MKKAVVIAVCIFTLMIFYSTEVRTNISGAPAGRTGAPGETTCINSCHVGNALNAGGGSVSIAISQNGQAVSTYKPNEEYDIVINLVANPNQPANLRAGFQITAINPNGESLGNFIIDNNTMKSVNTTIQGNIRNYITHKSAMNFMRENGATFQMKWKAPASTSGTASFYAAANSANGDGTSMGDFIYASSAILAAENVTSIFSRHNTEPVNFSLRGNHIHIGFDNPTPTATARIFSLSGKLVYRQKVSSTENTIEISNLKQGIYIIEVEANGQSYLHKFVK